MQSQISHKVELQELHIQEDYSEDNELEEAIWKLYHAKQTTTDLPTDVIMLFMLHM